MRYREMYKVRALFLTLLVYLTEAAFDPDELTSLLNTAMSEFSCIKTAALTVGVVINDPNTNFHITLGSRDVKKKIAADENTLFGIGSTTKAMTAIVTNKVLKEKGYTWKTPIVSFYPTFKLYGKERTEQVTFYDLYAHKTCVTRSDFWWASGPETFDIEQMMSKLQFLGEDCKFREKFKYNNLMYVAGAHIISELAGKTWNQLIQETILDPLKMSNTKTTFAEAYKSGNALLGYEPYEGEFVQLQTDADKIIDLVGQAGSVHSTAADMNKYMLHIVENSGAAYANLFWDEEKFPIGRYFGVTGKITDPPYPATSKMEDYTISWVLGEYQDEEVMVHGGDTFTTHAFITLSRKHEYGIFVSSTGGLKARRVNQLITWYIQDMISGKTPWIDATNICTFPADWEEEAPVDDIDPVWEDYLTDTSTSLKSYDGTYSHHVFGNVSVTFVEGEGLFFAYEKVNCTLRRKKESKNQFRCHANAPSLPSDTRIKVLGRILTVSFKDGNLHTNMMEQQTTSYQFNTALSPSSSLLLPLLSSLLILLTPL